MLSASSALHQLAALVWVGGMFFAYVVLRPVLAERAGPERLAIWQGVFHRFFRLVAVAIALLFVTGYILLFQGYGGFATAGVHVHVMHATGLLMSLLFVWLVVGPWRRLKAARVDGDGDGAAAALGDMRRLIATNLVLGILTVVVASSGSWWSVG